MERIKRGEDLREKSSGNAWLFPARQHNALLLGIEASLGSFANYLPVEVVSIQNCTDPGKRSNRPCADQQIHISGNALGCPMIPSFPGLVF